MAAATALTLSSAARQVSRSASTIFTREVTASHKLTIDGYSASRKLPQLPRMSWPTSQPFEAAGYTWRIRYFPSNGGKESSGGNDYYFHSDGKEGGDDDGKVGRDDDCISLYLELNNGDYTHNNHHVPIQFKFSLLDLAGNPVPGYSRSRKQCVFSKYQPGASIGFDDFVKWKDLQESGALKDGRFTIMCDITAIKDSSELDSGGAPVSSSVMVPPSDLHQQLSDLLWKQKHGADVTIDVAGETFDVHGWLLAARSPVFEAELEALTVTSSKGEKDVAARRVMKIKGMEPKVFKAMLHYIYTDTLPQELEIDQDSDNDSSSSSDEESNSDSSWSSDWSNDDESDSSWSSDDDSDSSSSSDDDDSDSSSSSDDDDTQLQDGDDNGSVDMARALLAAAHKYKLERLELMCEEALCRRIDVNTVAAILVAAEEHQCQALKAACVEFMVRPGCMKAIMKTRGFEEMKATCLPLLVELLVKQLA